MSNVVKRLEQLHALIELSSLINSSLDTDDFGQTLQEGDGFEAAFDELRKNSGIQFDKEIVDTFIIFYQEKKVSAA